MLIFGLLCFLLSLNFLLLLQFEGGGWGDCKNVNIKSIKVASREKYYALVNLADILQTPLRVCLENGKRSIIKKHPLFQLSILTDLLVI